MKNLKITVNGISYDVTVEESDLSNPVESVPVPAVAPVQQPAAPKPKIEKQQVPAAGTADDAVVSPMPGTIMDVKVSVGAKVAKGDILLILEAMKMENEIFADKDGTVSILHVAKGASVETGSPLVTIS